MEQEYNDYSYGSIFINKAKSLGMTGLYNFKLNHEMSTDSNMFDEMTIIEMDSCGSNFQTLIQNIAKVSVEVSGGWINSIISFYNNDVIKQDRSSSYKQIQAMSEKAQQIELAYKVIAISLGDMATRLKKAYVDTNEGNKSLVDLLKKDIADAEQNTASGKNLEFGQNKYDDGTAKEAAKQEMDLRLKNYYSSGSEGKMTIISDNAGDLVVTIQNIQTVINDVAEFFSTQSKLFVSKTRVLVGTVGAYSPSIIESIMRQNHTTASWADVKSAFINFGESLNSSIQLFDFETNVTPEPLQNYQFKKLNLQMSLPESEAVQSFMDEYVSSEL